MPFKINLNKLFETKIRKKELKRNLLVEFGLWLRHYIIEHKPTAYTVLGILIMLLIAIPIYLRSYYKEVNEANKFFEYGLGAYRRALTAQDFTPEERAKLLQDSIKQFQFVINEFSRTPPAADALFYQGNAYYELGDYNNALKKYEEYAKKYSRKYFADLALINVGKCYEQLNNFQGALYAYQKVVEKYSKRAGAAEALFHLGKIYELSNNINQAFSYYNKLVSEYPYSPWAREARLRVLFIQTFGISQPLKKK